MSLTLQELAGYGQKARNLSQAPRRPRGLQGEPAKNGIPPWLLPRERGARDGSFTVAAPAFDEATPILPGFGWVASRGGISGGMRGLGANNYAGYGYPTVQSVPYGWVNRGPAPAPTPTTATFFNTRAPTPVILPAPVPSAPTPYSVPTSTVTPTLPADGTVCLMPDGSGGIYASGVCVTVTQPTQASPQTPVPPTVITPVAPDGTICTQPDGTQGVIYNGRCMPFGATPYSVQDTTVATVCDLPDGTQGIMQNGTCIAYMTTDPSTGLPIYQPTGLTPASSSGSLPQLQLPAGFATPYVPGLNVPGFGPAPAPSPYGYDSSQMPGGQAADPAYGGNWSFGPEGF